MNLPGFGEQERAGVLWELSSQVPVGSTGKLLCYLFLISEKRSWSCSTPQTAGVSHTWLLQAHPGLQPLYQQH